MNPLPELQKGDAIKYGKDWMSFSLNLAEGHLLGWNLDSNGRYQMVTIVPEYIEEVWRNLIQIYKKENI